MEPLKPRRLQLVIQQEWAGMRVSSVLRYKLGMSGTVLRRIKWQEAGILLDGQRVHTNHPVAPGQILDVLLSDVEADQLFPPTEGPLDIVYEDRDILVINKPAGLTVHPGPGHYQDSLGNFILWHYQQEGERAKLHPVHRLDKGTSGLIVTAKHPFAQDKLRLQLHTQGFQRHYLAICLGVPEPREGTIDLPIGRDPDSIQKRRVCMEGDEAHTAYQVLKSNGKLSLVELELKTGRTHQIRVHMAAIGCPLAGDFLYGIEDRALISRPALHSAKLALCHPVTGERLEWSAPLPEDMVRLIR